MPVATVANPRLTPDRIARRAVSDVLRAVGAICDDRDTSPKAVHNLRRSCRTAGAVLELVADCVDSRAAARLQKRLRKIRKCAGVVRDLDVHAELANQILAGTPEAEDMLEEIENRRPAAAEQLIELLEEIKPSRLKRLRSRLKPADDRDDRHARSRIDRRTARWIEKARAVLFRPLPGEHQLHALRIDLKRLRIALRTLESLGVRATRRRQAIIAETARHLGRFHDLCTLREEIETTRPVSPEGRKRLLSRIRSEEAESVVHARNALRKLVSR
ncbi:MAG: CHAD domain-containing protein [Phycisphaerales bacterium]|nr:CHAD domain-containing protein [Planctomycetota bacterium]